MLQQKYTHYRYFSRKLLFYFYPRIVTNSNSFDNFPNSSRKQTTWIQFWRSNISGIGYKNDWIFIQLGRGRQAWGFGDDIQLGLSQNSNNYDHFVMEFKIEILPQIFSWIFRKDNINRFIVGKGRNMK